jgi:hypothetical protein
MVAEKNWFALGEKLRKAGAGYEILKKRLYASGQKKGSVSAY